MAICCISVSVYVCIGLFSKSHKLPFCPCDINIVSGEKEREKQGGEQWVGGAEVV